MSDQQWMQQAIQKTREGIQAGQSPFGALIVKGDRVVVCAHNTVWKDKDPTAHAEVNAIRQACRKLETIDLSDCVLYSTCEPCPMCLSAIHWSKLKSVTFGASIADAEKAGFSELTISAQEMVKRGQSPLKVKSGVMAEQCRALFDEWKKAGKCGTY
jgi:guanine deaminase